VLIPVRERYGHRPKIYAGAGDECAALLQNSLRRLREEYKKALPPAYAAAGLFDFRSNVDRSEQGDDDRADDGYSRRPQCWPERNCVKLRVKTAPSEWWGKLIRTMPGARFCRRAADTADQSRGTAVPYWQEQSAKRKADSLFGEMDFHAMPIAQLLTVTWPAR
jgi:hypothetical protein